MHRSWRQSITVLCGLLLLLGSRQAPAGDAVRLPDGVVVEQPDYARQITCLLTRLGCNAGTCHGSAQGKGDFRLSLFGQAPLADYKALRAYVDPVSPEESYLLQKALGKEDHGGGARLKEGRWEYQLLLNWIAQGAKLDPGSGRVSSLQIVPARPGKLAIGDTLRLKVLARFVNGDEAEVTALATLRVQEEGTAEVSPLGTLTARRSGDTSVIASYLGQFASLPVVIPYPNVAGLPRPVHNFIDQEIDAKLALLQLTASPLASDEEFLRRIYLDVIGTLPTSAQAQEFLADENPAKRQRLIDTLLAHPLRATLWATRMCDITACNISTLEEPAELAPRRAKMWHDWLRQRFARNMPYDQLVEGVLCATTRDDATSNSWLDRELMIERSARAGFDSLYAERPTLDLFWRRLSADGPAPVEDFAELTATAFLGTRLHCARCHQHPFDRWSQRDFASYAAIFSRVEFGSSTELRTAMNERLEARREALRAGHNPPSLPRIQEVFLAATPRSLRDADQPGPVNPRPLGGTELKGAGDPRRELFDRLRAAPDQQLAKAFVNRVWAKYLGRGLVEPVDAFSDANPPTHPRLLERLAAEFVKSGYDIVQLERWILASGAYQASSRPAGNNAPDRRNYAHALVRPLLAEVLVDAMNTSLEAKEDFGADAPNGSRAIEVATNRFSNPRLQELFRVLGRGERQTLCDCDRASGPSVRQSVLLMSDAGLQAKIATGRLARLLRAERSDTQIVEEFYLTMLARLPTPAEREFALAHVSAGERRERLADLVWALLNTREFTTNH